MNRFRFRSSGNVHAMYPKCRQKMVNYDYTHLSKMQLVQFELYHAFHRSELLNFVDRMVGVHCHLKVLKLFVNVKVTPGPWGSKLARSLSTLPVEENMMLGFYHDDPSSADTEDVRRFTNHIARGRGWHQKFLSTGPLIGIDGMGNVYSLYLTAYIMAPKSWLVKMGYELKV